MFRPSAFTKFYGDRTLRAWHIIKHVPSGKMLFEIRDKYIDQLEESKGGSADKPIEVSENSDASEDLPNKKK